MAAIGIDSSYLNSFHVDAFNSHMHTHTDTISHISQSQPKTEFRDLINRLAVCLMSIMIMTMMVMPLLPAADACNFTFCGAHNAHTSFFICHQYKLNAMRKSSIKYTLDGFLFNLPIRYLALCTSVLQGILASLQMLGKLTAKANPMA